MTQKVKLHASKEYPATQVHGLTHDGRGIATIDNKATFISGALPTETVKYRITQKKSQYNEASLVELVETSRERVTPPCEHFGICGGCSLQHMSISTQLELKQQTLLDQLKHFGKVTPREVMAPLSVNQTKYRRKARLGVKYVLKKEKLLIGFREKASNYLAELDRCVVLHESVGEQFDELKNMVRSLDAYMQIPQIEIAVGDTQTALVFRHLIPLTPSDLMKLSQFGEMNNFHIYLQPNSPLPVTKLYPCDEINRLSYTLPEFKLEFLFHPLDFTQINLEMNRQMVKQALNLLEINSNEIVLDLFCGIGNFTLPIAKFAKEVIGIEGSNEMVLRATENARHNGMANTQFYAANLQSPLENASWMDKTYDKILLDPPRAGAKELIPHLASFGAKKIVYVSCNPSTLARDAGELVNRYGYELRQVGIMNMFAHTSHIEAMAVFDNKG